MHFSFLAFFFGLVLYAASSGAAALAAGADSSWLWWSALLPIAASYWLSGILATSTSLHAMDRRVKLQSPRLLQPMIATISARNGASFRRNQGANHRDDSTPPSIGKSTPIRWRRTELQ